MKGPDEPALDMRDVDAGHDSRAFRRSGAPLQPGEAVVAQCRPDRGKLGIRRKLREQVRYGVRDRVPAAH